MTLSKLDSHWARPGFKGRPGFKSHPALKLSGCPGPVFLSLENIPLGLVARIKGESPQLLKGTICVIQMQLEFKKL